MAPEVTPTAAVAVPRAACCAGRVTVGEWLIAIAWSFFCPGAGQALVGKRWLALAWTVLTLGAMLGVPLTIWAVYAALAARLGAAVDAIVRIRRARPV